MLFCRNARSIRMKHRIFSAVLGIVLLCVSSVAGAQDGTVIRIGFVLDGPLKRSSEVIEIFRQEIQKISVGEFTARYPAHGMVDGGRTVRGVNSAIDHLMGSPDIDLIITLGHVASHEACRRHTLNKPVLAPFIIDARAQKLPVREGRTGIHNLNYIDMLRSIRTEMDAFGDIVSFRHMAVIVDGFMLEAIPELKTTTLLCAELQGCGAMFLRVKDSVTEALRRVPKDVDAVLVAPLLNITDDEFGMLVNELKKRRLPSFAFSYWGRTEVEQGLFATTTPSDTLVQVARQVAVNVHDIVRGEDAGALDTALMIGTQLAINMDTARAIDVYPSLRLMTEADLLNEERKDIKRTLTLRTVVAEALAANLDLSAADRFVSAGEQQVNQARSRLLPQVGLDTGATVIDDDRARAAGGQAPERTWTGSASGTQLIYSDRTWSNYAVQKHRQTSRVEGREVLRLDIIEAAATAYLNVLRAKTIERIQKNNLKLTRANLERARVRQVIGIAGPDEVYRWESEISRSRQTVLEAESQTLNAMNAVNRILHRPLSEPFIAEETRPDDPLLVVNERIYAQLERSPLRFSAFGDFMVGEGLAAAPELRQFDAGIAASNRNLIAARRGFWLPDFSLKGSVTELFAEDGTGTRSDAMTGLDDTEWSVGVFATFPLYTGGEKQAVLKRTIEDLHRLRIERSANAERIEERIRAAVNLTRASYPAIQLSRDAAEAARQNLKLIIDSYMQGIKSIIDLLDAQNLALVEEQRAANAVYDFLIDLVRLERASGIFDLVLDTEKRDAWYRKMETFFQQAGITLKVR